MTEPTAPADDVWTVQKILHWTTGYLEQKGIESPRLEAELLLAHARGCQRIHLYTDFDTALSDDERSRMRDFVKRRAQREPLAYITGQREFYGRNFNVGPGVLVPRPETETLIDVCLEHIPKQQNASICEVGFGSGCISITLAKQRPQLTVVASDISPTALEFASQNLTEHNIDQQVQLVAGNGFDPIRQHHPQLFDGIVSNPPYIREDELAELAPEVAQHEPKEALVSGTDGLDLVRRLVEESTAVLRPGGWMAMEVDPAQCQTLANLLTTTGFERVTIHQDLNGDDRIVSGVRSQKG